MVNKTRKTIKKILIAVGIMTLFAVNLFAINHFAINKFRLTEPTSIGIIGGADGPTAIYLSSTIDIVLLKFIWLPLLLIINVWVGWRFYKKRRKKEK